jgi:hypothetical protein
MFCLKLVKKLFPKFFFDLFLRRSKNFRITFFYLHTSWDATQKIGTHEQLVKNKANYYSLVSNQLELGI